MKQIIVAILLLGNIVSSLAYAKPASQKSSVSEKLREKIEVLSWSPRIVIYHQFLSTAECDHLMAQAKPFLVPSQVVDDRRPNGTTSDTRRKSEGMFFPTNHNDPILSAIEKRISLLTLIPPAHGENIQVVHYQVGGEYQPHYDYFNVSSVGGASQLSRGGQRVASFLMYLNTPTAGGKTVFPKVNIEVTPVKGDALLFFDCNVDGTVDSLTFHGGAPVIQGEKWLATRWLRQYPFR
jgi:prolyl 4-hydroxylase